MKRNHSYFKRIASFVFVLMFLQSTAVLAQSFHHKERSSPSATTIKGFDVLNGVLAPDPAYQRTVEGELFSKLDPNATNSYAGHIDAKEVRGYLELRIRHEDNNVYEPYTYRFVVKVTGYTDPGNTTPSPSFVDQLTVSYDPDSTNVYQDKHYRTYYGFYKMDYEILDIIDLTCMYTVPPSCTTAPTKGFLVSGGPSQSTIAENWELDGGIIEQKYEKDLLDGGTWKSALGSSTQINISGQLPAANTDNYLTINWNVVNNNLPDPSMYELEWTYVDDYDVTFSSNNDAANTPGVLQVPVSNLNYNFKDNSTRVITDKEEYKIPLIYKRGYIVYRVRLIRPNAGIYKYNLYSPWTIANDKGSFNSISPNTNYVAVGATTSQMDDQYNWNFESSFAEEGKSKSVVSFYDGLLKNRQTITKLNTAPSQQIVAETYYDYEGKPSLQTLPIPVEENSLKFISGFAFPNGSATTSYQPSDIDSKQPTTLTGLSSQSPASNYYSPANSIYANGTNSGQEHLKRLPDAEGFPLIHTQYSPEDGRVTRQGGAGSELQIGGGHDTRNYYLQAGEYELDKYFGYNIGKAPFYDKTITRDPNQQLSFNITNNKGQTILSGLMGYPPTGNPTSPLVLPDGVQATLPSDNPSNFPPVDMLYGNERLWEGAVGRYNIPKFIEKSGNIIMDHTLSLPSFAPCGSTFMNVPIDYDIKLYDEYGASQTVTSGTVGTVVTGTSSVTHSVSNLNITKAVDAGKSIIDYKISYDPNDVDAAINSILYPVLPDPITTGYVSPYPSCLKDKDDFTKEEMENINLDCEEEGGEEDCALIKQALMNDIFPGNKYAKYEIDASGVVTSTTGMFSPGGTGYTYKYQEFIDQNKSTIASATGQTTSFLDELLAMDGKTFIESFKASPDVFTEILLPYHYEYCKYLNTVEPFNCDEESLFVRNMLAIKTAQEASDLGYYRLTGTTNPLTDLANADPALSGMGTGGAQKFMYIDVFDTDNGGGTSHEERIDAMVYVKLFCTNTVCRDYALNYLSEDDIQNVIHSSSTSTEKRNQFYYELSRVYAANRRTKIERRKATLNNNSCAYTHQQPTLIGSPIIKIYYDNESDQKPTSNTDYFTSSENAEISAYLGSSGASTLQNTVYGKIKTQLQDGFDEYAAQIAKKLANCRHYSSGVFDESAFISTLVSTMNTNVTNGVNPKWKGGITPHVLKGLLTTSGFPLDDLCNPYLVDYLQEPNFDLDSVTPNGDCKSAAYYANMYSFLNNTSNRQGIYSGMTNSGNNSIQNVSTALQFSSTPVEFEADLMTTLLGSTTGYSNNIFMKVQVNNATKELTIYFFTGTFNINTAVILYCKGGSLPSGDPPPTYQNLTLNTRAYLVDYDGSSNNNYLYCTLNFNALGCDTYHPSYYNGEVPIKLDLFNNLTVVGQANSNDPTDITYSMTGYVAGLSTPTVADPIEDQSDCITCVELKKVFQDFKDTVMAARIPNQINHWRYEIFGVGHPLFEDALRSFLNFRFERNFTSQEYLDLIEGCDLARHFKIPEYYSYVHASSTDTNSLNVIYNAIKSYDAPIQGTSNPILYDVDLYSTFEHFYYFKTNASNVITEGNLYIDFNSFRKSDLRTMRDLIATTNTGIATNQPVLNVNRLEKDIRNTSLTFADLFVHHIPGAQDHNPYVMTPGSNIAPPYKNWVPNLCGLQTYSCNNYGTDDVTLTDELVTVRDRNHLLPFRHFRISLTSSSFTNDKLSEMIYSYNTGVLPDESRTFRSKTQYFSTLNSDNQNTHKKDYLNYVYSLSYPTNASQKKTLIYNILPAQLKANIQGNGLYINNYLNAYVSYYNASKKAVTGDLVVRAGSSNISEVENIINATKTSHGSRYFPDYYSYTQTVNGKTEVVTVKRMSNNIYWYNLVDQTTKKHRNIWLQFPKHFPSKVGATTFDIEDFTYWNTTIEYLPNSSRRRFRIFVGSANSSPFPLNKDYPAIEVLGKTDFDIAATDDVFENVMLCSDFNSDYDDINTCYEKQLARAEDNAEFRFLAYLDSVRRSFQERFATHIKTKVVDDLKLRMPQAKYIVTLYGYDRAGNLSYTVPPEGIVGITPTATILESIKQYREDPYSFPEANVSSIRPYHNKITSYQYNSLNKLTNKTTPDGGETVYYYDQAGRLLFSQNAKQEANNNGSYTLYDKQNRIIETGEVKMNLTLQKTLDALKQYNYSTTGFDNDIHNSFRKDVIHTFYDEELFNLATKTGMSKQEFLRNRVATVATYKNVIPRTTLSTNYSLAIHYSYDVSGNVKSLTYDMPMLEDVDQRYKRIDYDYDLYSGKVTLVSYNRGFADQYYQRYDYDADNRITRVQTSKDGLLWDDDAEYTYFPHGPLARISLGDLRVQGVDFVYTLQGWLKSINGDTPDPAKDYGGDGYLATDIHQKDMMQSSLYYFENDYKAIDGTDFTGAQGTSMTTIPDLDQNGAMQSLYNGNIAAMLSKPAYFPALYSNYVYDQLNRIKSATYKLPDYTAASPNDVLKDYSSAPFNGSVLAVPGQSAGITADDIYKTEFTYDWDGNLKTLNRNGLYTGNDPYNYVGKEVYKMDELTYHYQNAGTNIENNKLINFEDASDHATTTSFNNDLQNYTDPNAALSNRFEYDEIGNMTADHTNELSKIWWNVYGKVTKVEMATPGKSMEFMYDPLNNRFMKTTKDAGNGTENHEFYIRDASGNVLAIYRQQKGYTTGNPVKDVLQPLGPKTTFSEDISDVYTDNGTFGVGLVQGIINIDMGSAEIMADDVGASFYLTANSGMRNAVIEHIPAVVDDILQADATIITDPLHNEYDELFFAPLIYETDDATRKAFIGEIIDVNDVTTMTAIAQQMIPDVYIADKDAFVDFVDYARTHVSIDEIHNALKTHLTGQKLTDAVDNLMANTDFMNNSFPVPYENMQLYFKDLVKQKGDVSKINTYITNKPDALDLIKQTTELEDRLFEVYTNDPEAFVQSIMTRPDALDLVEGALQKIDGMSPTSVLNALLRIDPNDVDYIGADAKTVLGYHKTYLAEHTLYGSARLGIKSYWPTQYAFEWDINKTVQDNKTALLASPFHYRHPWYFKDYNSLIKANAVDGYGNGNDGTASGTRVLGLKRYELSNHLGNVMAVVTDKVTEVPPTPSTPLPAPKTERAALHAAYDYYPFGMLMPERYIEDKKSQCVPVTKTKIIKAPIKIIDVVGSGQTGVQLFTGVLNTTVNLLEGPPDVIEIGGNNIDPIEATLTLADPSVVAGVNVEFNTVVTNNDPAGNPVIVALIQDDGTGNDITLDQATIDVTDNITLAGEAISGMDMRVVYSSAGGVGATVSEASYYTIDVVQEDYIVVICNDNGEFDSDYRFGFNGKHKDNKLKGTGNSYDYGLRIQDTRLGRFMSVDPLSPEYPWYSTYHFSGNSPIRFIDLDGGEPKDYLPEKYYISSSAIKASNFITLSNPAAFNTIQVNNVKKYIKYNNDIRSESPFSTTRQYQNANPTGPHDCITSVNNSLNILLNLPEKNLWLNGSTIDKSMEELSQMGFANRLGEVFFINNSGKETKNSPDQSITTMKGTISEIVKKRIADKNASGYHVFSLSMLDGYHSMLLFVDNRNPDDIRYTLADQVDGWNGVFDEGMDPTGGIDGYLTSWAKRNMNRLLGPNGQTNKAQAKIAIYEINTEQKKKD